MGWELAAHRGSLSAGLREKLEWGLAQGGAALVEARGVFGRLQGAFAGVMEGVDVLLTPSAVGEAPLGLEGTGDAAFNLIWTGLGAPCVTVPAGVGPGGMPLGVQVVGRIGGDRGVLAAAGWVVSVLG